MEKIIEQIKEIKGVKTVEVTKKGFKGTFEPQLTSVKVETLEQLDFMWLKVSNPSEKHGLLFNDMCVYTNEAEWNREEDAKKDSTVLSFTQYLKDYNLQDEWEKYLIGEAEKRGFAKGVKHYGMNGKSEGRTFIVDRIRIDDFGCLMGNSKGCIYLIKDGEWAEIIKEEIELVEGEIYTTKDNELWSMTFRFKSMMDEQRANYYSSLNHYHSFKTDDWCLFKSDNRKCKPATDKQKRKLIKAEVKNNYFHELAK